MKEIKFNVVAMKDVPDTPVGVRWNKFSSLYAELKKLGLMQKEAVRVEVEGPKALAYARTQLRSMAKRDKLMLCSSRNQDSTVAFFWLIKPDQR